jgi:hypothetical protein
VVEKRKKKPEYIKLKNPEDVMSYVQRLVNRLRREDQELEQLGKITYLLNTWITSFKAHIEFTEVRKLREDIDKMLEEMNRNGGH